MTDLNLPAWLEILLIVLSIIGAIYVTIEINSLIDTIRELKKNKFPPKDEFMNTNQGEILRAIRKRRGVTLETVAKKTGLTPSAISLIETGKVNPNDKTLPAILKALRTSEGTYYLMLIDYRTIKDKQEQKAFMDIRFNHLKRCGLAPK